MMIGISPAMLALVKPQLKAALENLLRSQSPREVAAMLVPHIEELVDRDLGPEIVATLDELARQLARRSQGRSSKYTRRRPP